MKNNNYSGFTLIELLITLAIISIFFNVALPSYNDFISGSKMSAEVNSLVGILQYSRGAAITESKKVTICPTLEGKSCSKDWSEGYMAFVDENEDRNYNGSDKLLYQHRLDESNIRLRWRAFGVRSSMQWHETGITNHQNGSFEFCYKEKPTLSRGLFITKAGRVRSSKDTDGNGIHENAVGNDITC